MKKILTIFFIFVSMAVYGSPDGKAYIGSFNALHLGESKKDYKELSNILVLLDIIGLQEVSNREGVETLVDELEKNTNEKWEYHISPYPVGTKKI